jgi:hypothetical protein
VTGAAVTQGLDYGSPGSACISRSVSCEGGCQPPRVQHHE